MELIKILDIIDVNWADMELIKILDNWYKLSRYGTNQDTRYNRCKLSRYGTNQWLVRSIVV